MKRSSQEARSYCVDGDIRLAAGEIAVAAEFYLLAHIADSVCTKEHLVTLPDEQREVLLPILHGWVKESENNNPLEDVSVDQIWEFIFCLEPEAIKICESQISGLFAGRKYEQVSDCCTAVLRQFPVDTIHLLVQRGLARTLMGGHEKEAIADYLRSFLKDKDMTYQVVGNQKDFLPHVKLLMGGCIHSKPPPRSDPKAYNQWLALTLDCCRFLLLFEPNDFRIQMTFVHRLMELHKCDRAITMLSEILERLLAEKDPDPDKLTEVLLRRACNYFTKQDNTRAIEDTTKGLNARLDCARMTSSVNDDEIDFLLRHNEITLKIVKTIFEEIGKSVNEIVSQLERSASRLTQDDRFKSVVKLENIRCCIDYYRAVLALQPTNKEISFKLAILFSKYGKGNLAIKVYNRLMGDPNTPLNHQVLAARAICNREAGNKEEAKKDYALLLQHNPYDVTFLCERAILFLETDDVPSGVQDLLVASKVNQKLVVTQLNREALALRSRIKQILFEYAKMKLQESTEVVGESLKESENTATISVAVGVAQLLTKLNPADHSCHILHAHALFNSGFHEDAETNLKKMMNGKSQGIGEHVIKLHLGIMKIFTNRRDEGMIDMIDILANKGERIFASALRDLPLSERSKLSEISHQYGISVLHKSRDASSVKQSIKCFTLAILFCRDSDLVLEGRNEGEGFYKSYLARAECMAHIGEQKAAILDFSAAIEIYPRCVDGLCGRAFMRLALGQEAECISDIEVASDLDMENVIAHIQALPEEAKNILLSWIDQRVVALLLNYGYRSGDRLNTGGSTSTISMLDETVFYCASDVSRDSSFSSLPSYPILTDTKASRREEAANSNKVLHKSETKSRVTGESLNHMNLSLNLEHEAVHDNIALNNDNSPTRDLPSQPKQNESQTLQSKSVHTLSNTLSSFPADEVLEERNVQKRGSDVFLVNYSSYPSTSTSQSIYDDSYITMEKVEIIERAHLLADLLIAIDDGNASYQGMFADILIVKGDYEKALRHLRVVMGLNPNDITATTRAGIINIKMSRYREACKDLSGLASVDRRGLKCVLKAVVPERRRRLCVESINYAELLIHDGKFTAARDCYSLSVLADSFMKVESLRMRSRCHMKLGDCTRAIADISEVIKEQLKSPQARDYCYRASLYLAEKKEFQACRDYMKGISLDSVQASNLINVRPGKNIFCDLFLKQATVSYTRHNFEECATICEVAIVIDDANIEIRKLRARAKREISKCSIQ